MTAILAFVLITISANGSVGMQEFNSEAACKAAKTVVRWDDDAKKFRTNIDAYCVPKQ